MHAIHLDLQIHFMKLNERESIVDFINLNIVFVFDYSAPPQGFGPCGMPPNQAQYHQPQQQPPQAPPQQQSSTIYSTQLSQASYGSNQVCSLLNHSIC